MSGAATKPSWPLPGVLRVHFNPGALPRLGDEPGANRFDDPRPRTIERFLIRYAGSSLRGCLLELLAGLRESPQARQREASINDAGDPDFVPAPTTEPWQHIADFLNGRKVARLQVLTPAVVSINDPRVQAQLDEEPGVRAVLDTSVAQGALLPKGTARVRLDNAAVRLSGELGRLITQGCALALYDLEDRPDVIHYRSRHDDSEDCWAIYHHADVNFDEAVSLSPSDPDHQAALRSVATLWSLPLPPVWQSGRSDRE